jgi:aryl-alcohol dehydrogenase-like predicted oxidoreductase
MEYRLLGRSGLKISTLTLGTMTFGGTGGFAAVGNTDLESARRQVDIALDAGVNLIDTADVYSDGLSEEIVGKVMAGRREAALLTTKVRFPMGDGPNDEGLSRHHIIAGCEASLRRLGTDYLDLYQLHEWDGQTPLEETLAALDHLVSAGKVRYVGVSNFAGWQLLKTIGTSRHGSFPPIVSQQIHYTLQAREAEYELVPAAVDSGIGILVWSPLAGGLLSGKYRRGQEPPTGARDLAAWGEPPVRDQEALYDIVEVLVDVAGGLGVSPAEVALAWTLGRPGVTSLVIGARTDDQLRTNLRAAELTLSAEDVDRLERASRPPLLYPYWHQAGSAAARLSEADLTLLRRHLP